MAKSAAAPILEKISKTASQPKPRKIPKASPPQFRGGPLAWRFGSHDKGGPFAWSALPDADYRRVVERLHEFENMEQSDITKSGSHTIEVWHLCKPAQDRLSELELDDIDELMSFRITGRQRVFCLLIGNIMRVLWWDPDHQVCPSVKKHT